MSEERPSTKSIIGVWHSKFAETFYGEGGTAYLRIPNSVLMEAFWALARTFKKLGFTYEEMSSPYLAKQIVDVCWREDKIRKISVTDIKKAKFSMALDWQQIIDNEEFTGIQICDAEMPDRTVAKVEPKKIQEKIESKPIKMDISDMADVPFDNEILAELAAIGTVLEEKDE